MVRRSKASQVREPFYHRFMIGDISVEIRGDLERVIDDLSSLYPSESHLYYSSDQCIQLRVERSRRKHRRSGRYDIVGGGQRLSKDVRSEELIPYLEWAINDQMMTVCSRHLQVHAASLAFRNTGAIFAGTSGAGKSTLAAGLVARGWTYYCDEFALIDPETMCLRSFPKALCVKSGAFDVIDHLDLRIAGARHYVKAFKGRVGYVSSREIAGHTAARPCEIGLIFFPSYIGQKEPSIRPLTRGRAAISLLGQTLNAASFGPSSVSAVHRILEHARCYVLEAGQIDATCDLIESVA